MSLILNIILIAVCFTYTPVPQEDIYIPTEQPQINAQTSAENNEKMRKYLWNNRIEIQTTGKTYISFITEKEIKENTNIFIAIDGRTIWWLDKKSKNRIKTENPREFKYPIHSIDLIGNNNYKFKVEIKDTLQINAVVGEDKNKIEQIKTY